MNPPRLRLVGMTVSLLFAAVLPVVGADRLVAINAVADSDYLVRRASAGNPAEGQTYVLAKGRHTSGVDAGLSKVTFASIAAVLSVDLMGGGFIPAKSVEAADQVIVVHWGMTDQNENAAARLQYDPDSLRQAVDAVATARERESTDSTGMARALGASAAAEAHLNSEKRLAESLYAGDGRLASSNAEILGFQSALSRGGEMAETLREMLDEERYFIVLEAYDGPSLRTGAKRKLWVTRMSVRSPGVNFPIAMDRMSSVAALFNGTQQNNLILLQSRRRQPSEKPAEVIVIGDAGKPATGAKR